MEIETGNRLIAEFMGFEAETFYKEKIQGYYIPDMCYFDVKYRTASFKPLSELKFHISYDWIHPVVIKINEIEPNKLKLNIVSDISEIFREVVDFIKWHNNQ